MNEAAIPVNQRHFAAKAAEGLGQFQPDVTGAQHQEMAGDMVQLQRLDVSQWTRLSHAVYRIKRRPAARVDNDVLTAKDPHSATDKLGLNGPGRDKPASANNQFGAAAFVIIEVDVDQSLDH